MPSVSAVVSKELLIKYPDWFCKFTGIPKPDELDILYLIKLLLMPDGESVSVALTLRIPDILAFITGRLIETFGFILSTLTSMSWVLFRFPALS